MLKDRPGQPQTAAFRCSTCNYDWPLDLKYKVCPSCNEDLGRASGGVEPMSEEEALSIVSYIKFTEYYEATRGVSVDAETDPRFDPHRPGITIVDNILMLPEKT